MKKRIFIIGCLSLLSLGCSAVPAAHKALQGTAQEQPPKQLQEQPQVQLRQVVVENYTWIGKIPEQRKVIITNLYGNVSSRLRSERQIGISATIQKIGVKPAEPSFDIKDVDGVTVINVNYPDGQKDSTGHLIGRVDVSVIVPENVAVQMQTSYGDISAKKHFSSITAKTDSGNIALGSVGELNAYSVSGDISVDMYNIAWKHDQKVHTEQGNIKAYVAQQADIAVHVNGKSISHNLTEFATGFIQLANTLDFTLKTSDNREPSQAHWLAPNGQVQLQVISKPHGGYVALPGEFDGDIRNLPTAKSWQPGDPIREQDDKGRGKKRSD